MKIAVDIEDKLLSEAEAAAARQGVSLAAFIEIALLKKISARSTPAFVVDEDGLPVLTRPRGLQVTPEDIRRLIEEE